MATDQFGHITSQGGRPYPKQGATTPGIEYSETERPAIPYLPAPYLPATRFDYHKRANVVLSAGTPIGVDVNSNLIPAGTPGGHVYTYSTLDLTPGLRPPVSPVDGQPVAVVGNYLANSGLTTKVGKFCQSLGVVSYNVFQHEGNVDVTAFPEMKLDHSNPAHYGIHNTMAQDVVAITTSYMLLIPYVYGKNLLSPECKILDNTANECPLLSDTAKSYPFAHDELQCDMEVQYFFTTGEQTRAVGISGHVHNFEITYVSPNCGTGDDGCAASNATFLTITSGATGLTFTAPGDTAGAEVLYSDMDNDSGVLGHNLVPMYSNDISKYILVRNRYGREVSISQAEVIFRLKLESPLKPGDQLICRLGKFIKFNDDIHDHLEIIGTVYMLDKTPAKKDYLDRVKTAYDRSAEASNRMAGSATRGMPQLLHLVSDGAQVLKDTNKTLAGSALSSAGMTTPPLAQIIVNMIL